MQNKNNYAVVDLGSNTIRLSVYQVQPDGSFHLLFSEKEMAGLANYISGRVMRPEGFQRASQALLNFRKLLAQFGMEEVHVFATASLRNIRNTEEAVAAIFAQTGLLVDVISGQEEAQLGYYGALQGGTLRDGVLFDIGGGSTELVSFAGGAILEARSLEIGSLNLFRRNVEKIWPKKAEIQGILAQIQKSLDQVPLRAETVCGVGGTARAMLKLRNARFRTEGRTISIEELETVTALLRDRSREARDLILEVCPDRLHTIIPGALLMTTLAEKLEARVVTVSPYGVREGYLCRKLRRDTI